MAIPILTFAIALASFESVASDDKLIFVQVLFRHGARAPSEQLTSDSYQELFPRGLGELTDRGFNNSYHLGKFLKKRYVDSGFLDENMQPREMYWRSVNKNRCLSTASTVGAAMFESANRYLHVPVHTEETGEKLLNYDQNNCAREIELVKEKCPGFSGSYHPWPAYEEFVAKCLNYSHPALENHPFHTLEAHINQYKNGIPLPAALAENLGEIMSMYVRVTQWITGTGYHHDPRMMKVKFGNLMTTLIANMLEYHGDIGDLLKKRKKFRVYSTQDWILMGVLDSFGVLNETVGLDVYPEYNSMIIMEVWQRDHERYLKMFYKSEEKTELDHQLIDVSNLIRGCPRDQTECPLENIASCCTEYTVPRHQSPCASENTQSGSRENRRRRRRFAGPR